MKVICDENLILEPTALPESVELMQVNGRAMDNALLRDAEALLVRSVTKVNKHLLANTGIGFVGTATSGTDHLDLQYLKAQGIQWAAAAGSNADAVVDYCLACIAHWSSSHGRDIGRLKLGVVGAGQVGSRLIQRLSGSVAETLVCDPPLRESCQQDQGFVTLKRISACDIVSLHVPYTRHGRHPTAGMIDTDFLRALPENCLLINSCRGGVVNETALRNELSRRKISAAIDVWQGEPAIDGELADAAFIATPHIAGYSALAKRTAGSMIAQALSRYVEGADSACDRTQASTIVSVESESTTPLIPDASVWHSIRNAFDLASLSANFKADVAQGKARDQFDSYRKSLASRKEFRELQVETSALNELDRELYHSLGFKV